MATNEIFSSHFTRETEQTTRSTTSCPECGGDLLPANHETRCRECGLIVDEDHLDYGPEWFDSPENSSRRRTGTPLTAGRHDRGLSTVIGWQKDGQGNTIPGRKRSQLSRLRREHRRSQWRSKRERNLGYSLGEVRRIVSALELPDSLCEQACMLFRRAQGETSVRDGHSRGLQQRASTQCVGATDSAGPLRRSVSWRRARGQTSSVRTRR